MDTSLTFTNNMHSEINNLEIKQTVDGNTVHDLSKSKPINSSSYKWEIVWRNVIWYIVLHALTIYGLYLILSGQIYLKTLIFCK